MSRDTEFTALFNKARAVAVEAGMNAKPTTMVVVGGGKRFEVPDGPCGFAWVQVRPGTSSFAKWLVRHNKARKDSYAGGVRISIHDFNQSMVRKEAAAFAMANVLQESNIRASASSRMD